MFKISYDKKITIVQGDTGVIKMKIHNYELSQGDEVRFAIINKATPSILLCQHSDKKIVLEKQVTAFEKDGGARIVIYPYDTESLQPGKYLYEIQVKTKDGRVDTVVPLTSFTVMEGSIEGEYSPTGPGAGIPGAGTNSSDVELRFKRIENEIIPELGTRITNVENEIDSVSSSLDNITVILDFELGEFENYASCINRLVRDGKIVKLLNHEYDLIEPIILVSNSTILMGDKTKLNRKHSGIMVYGEYDLNTTEYNGVENIYIEGGILNQASYDGETNMTAFCHASNITFNNVTFLDCCNVHCIDLQGCKDVYINNCKFLGYKSIGQSKFREQVQIDMATASAMGLGDNNNFPNNSPLFDGTRCENIHITGCLFDKSENHPPAHNCIGTHSQGEKSKKGIGRSSNIFIKDNIFKGNGLIYTTTEDGQIDRRSGKGIRLLQYDNVFIENNVFNNFAKAISIECLNYVWTVDYNKVDDKEFLDTQILGNNNIFVRGNKIECCSFDTSTEYDYTWNGISITSALDYINHKNIFIQNNIVTNDKTHQNKSIGIQSTDNCIIRDNILNGGYCGIYVNASECKNVLTCDNLFSDLDINVDYVGGTTNGNGHGLLMNIDGGTSSYLIYLPQSQTNDILRMKDQSTGKIIDFVTKDTLDAILREYNLIE